LIYIGQWISLGKTAEAMVLDEIAEDEEVKLALWTALADGMIAARALVDTKQDLEPNPNFPRVKNLGTDWFFYSPTPEVWASDTIELDYDGRVAVARDIEINRKDVLELFLSESSEETNETTRQSHVDSATRRGPKEQYPWDDILQESTRFLMTVSSEQSHADLIRHLLDWYSLEYDPDRTPSEDRVRTKSKPIFQGYLSATR
jgi:hypothetical protein